MLLSRQLLLSLHMMGPGSSSATEPSIAMSPIVSRGRSEAATQIDAERVEAALREGLARGATPVHRLERSCADRACSRDAAREAGHTHVIVAELERSGPDHRLALTVVSVATGADVASTRRTCEICGQQELVSTASDLAATFSVRLARLGSESAMVAITGEPVGATVTIDGRVVGVVPWDGELSPGEHSLRVESEGYVPSTRALAVDAGVREHVAVTLAPRPVAPASDEPRVPATRSERIAGWSLLGAGVASVGVGVAMFAVDGRPHRPSCPPSRRDPAGACPNVYEATTAGAVATSIGAAAVVAGAVLVVRAWARRRRAPEGRAP